MEDDVLLDEVQCLDGRTDQPTTRLYDRQREV
jgi:hypothetical protein